VKIKFYVLGLMKVEMISWTVYVCMIMKHKYLGTNYLSSKNVLISKYVNNLTLCQIDHHSYGEVVWNPSLFLWITYYCLLLVHRTIFCVHTMVLSSQNPFVVQETCITSFTKLYMYFPLFKQHDFLVLQGFFWGGAFGILFPLE
jgi:hypothetical protein